MIVHCKMRASYEGAPHPVSKKWENICWAGAQVSLDSFAVPFEVVKNFSSRYIHGGG